MIELFRHYWWAALVGAALVVIVTHALLVKLIADSEKKPADKHDQH